MPTIYRLENAVGEVVSWHPTLKAAKADKDWWKERGDKVAIRPINYQATKVGVAALLNAFGANA